MKLFVHLSSKDDIDLKRQDCILITHQKLSPSNATQPIPQENKSSRI